jgi:hypothetical protein
MAPSLQARVYSLANSQPVSGLAEMERIALYIGNSALVWGLEAAKCGQLLAF